MSPGTVEGRGSTRGRRGRPRGSGRGSRATRTGREATTNRGRIPRHGSGEVSPTPAEERVGGGEREGGDGEGGGSAPGSVTQLRAFIADDQSGTTCVGCKATIARGHRVVGLPCGRQHAIHARCVVNAVRRGGAQASLLCGARGCTVRHGRREAIQAAVLADPGLHVTAAGLGGIPDDGKEERRDGLCYSWDQNTLGIAGSLDDVPLEDLQQRFVTVVKVQPRLATAHAKLITHVLGLLDHALGEHHQSTQSETPQSLLRSIKLWYILPALLHSQEGRMKRRERFASAERGDLTLLLPWLMEYTRRTSTRRSAQARKETDADIFKKASSACRHRGHRGGVTVAARSLLAEPCALGNEETWERVKANFPEEDQTCVSELQRQRWQQVPPTRRKGVFPTGARRKNSTHRWHSRSSILATRFQKRESTACVFRTCSQ